MRAFRYIPALLALAALTLHGCAGRGGAAPPVLPPDDPGPEIALEVRPAALEITPPGAGIPTRVHPIEITLTVTAPAARDFHASLPTSQLFDFHVMYSGVEVWRWSHGQEFAAVRTDFHLPAGGARVFRETWLLDDAYFVAGGYRVHAVFLGNGAAVSAPLRLAYPE